jgi:hypothetical protein
VGPRGGGGRGKGRTAVEVGGQYRAGCRVRTAAVDVWLTGEGTFERHNAASCQ